VRAAARAVEARGARVLAGPFACALVGSAHPADGNSRCAASTRSPSRPRVVVEVRAALDFMSRARLT